MNHLWLDCGFEIKVATAEGHIEGLGAVFGNVDLGFDKILPGAFRETLKKLKGGVPMLWQHRPDQPIGVWDQLSEDKRGLRVAGDINQDVQKGREARSLARQGAVKGLSIGYRPVEFEFDDEVRILKRVDLIEISLATFPMNTRARITGVKNDSPKELERHLREAFGLSRRASKHVGAVIRGLDYSSDQDFDDHEDVTDNDNMRLASMLSAITKGIRA